MNMLINSLLYILLGILTSINSLSGQSKTTPVFSKSIKLNGETEVKDIILPIGNMIPLKDSLNSITISIISSIEEGELTINVYDPAGKGNGSFTILGKNKSKAGERINNHVFEKFPFRNIDNSNEKASGLMTRTINQPMRGDWKAKITSKGAIGNITIQLGNQEVN